MKKKGLTIALSVLTALVIILAAIIIALWVRAKSEKKPESSSTAQTSVTQMTTEAETTTAKASKATTAETTETETTTEKVYDDLKLQYLSKVKDTDSMILVIGDGTVSGGTLYYYVRDGEEWNLLYECYAVVGENGYSDHTYEGDRTTPTGCFDLGIAFGIMDNPGTALEWVDVNEYLYWVADPENEYYEQLVDVREVPYTWNDSEHLIEFYGYYNYCIHIKVNPPYTTSAIFLHCSCGGYYTGGCVGIDEDSMIWVLGQVDEDTKITIAEYEEDLMGMLEN